jgi:hypothetical protein
VRVVLQNKFPTSRHGLRQTIQRRIQERPRGGSRLVQALGTAEEQYLSKVSELSVREERSSGNGVHN